MVVPGGARREANDAEVGTECGPADKGGLRSAAVSQQPD